MELKVEALIREVKRHPCLYAKGTLDYSNKDLRLDAWQHISNAVDMDAKLCMGKWRSLRDRYVKECNKEIEIGYKSRWRFATQLGFLRPYVSAKKDKWKTLTPKPPTEHYSIDSMDENETIMDTQFHYENTMDAIDSNEYENAKDDEDIQQAAQEEVTFENVFKAEKESSNPLSQEYDTPSDHELPKRKYRQMEDSYLTLLDRVTNIQEKWIESRHNKHSGFLQMVADKLNLLPPMEQEDAKMLFLNYLHSKIKKQKNINNKI